MADSQLLFKRRPTNDKKAPVSIIRPRFDFCDGSDRITSAADVLFWVTQKHQVTWNIWSADDTDDGWTELHTDGTVRKSLGRGKRSMDIYGYQYFVIPKQAV